MARQIRTKWVVMVGLALVVAMADTASAQRRGRGFGRLFGGIAKADLATLDGVQSELAMTDEQKTKAEEVSDQLRRERRDLFQSGFGELSEIRSEMDELNRKASDDVNQLLDENQQKRLREIAIQVNGPAELSDPAVASELQITDEQQSKLDEAREQNSESVREVFLDFGNMSRDERRAKRDELSKSASEKLLGILTDDQRAQFELMEGAEFDVDLSQLRGRGRRGGGGPRDN
jgi:Spy/CpxP family protein refolding chaperone